MTTLSKLAFAAFGVVVIGALLIMTVSDQPETEPSVAQVATSSSAKVQKPSQEGSKPLLGDSNVASLARRTVGIAPYLDIPAVVERPNHTLLKPYFAERAGMKVRYVRNVFSLQQPDLAWVPMIKNGRSLLRWQSFDDTQSGIVGIYPGNELELLDNLLYDFGVGSLFVKAKLLNGAVGYILLETLVGEMEPVEETSGLVVAKYPAQFRKNSSIEYEGVRLYEQTMLLDLVFYDDMVTKLSDPNTYATTLSGGNPGGVHPVYATANARSVLYMTLREEVDEERKAKGLAAVETFMREYVLKDGVEVKPGLLSWPYKFEWITNWGIKLSPPWYSPYANSQITAMAALLYRMTGKPEYDKVARDSVPFITAPISKGGSQYEIAGFKLPAEYVYNTPPIPNIRVIDGEFAVAIGLYNAARLMGDSDMLAISTRYFASLAMQMEVYAKDDGDFQFASYVEDMPEGYRWSMWALFQNSAIITKDRRFSKIAAGFTKFINEAQCESLGC